MRIVEHSIHIYRLPYHRPVKWFNSSEDHGVFALLRVVSNDGAVGVASTSIKPTWSGVSPRSLSAAIDDLLMPAVRELDIADTAAVDAALARFPENHIGKMLVDNACWTLRAASAGEPLWKQWGGNRDVELSWCVTRQTPELMAKESADVVDRFGFRALKVKGGQGFDVDRTVLREIRAACGDDVDRYVDANCAYSMEEAPDYTKLLGGEGALVAEDPCTFRADKEFAALVKAADIPILVDSPCLSAYDAAQFLRHDAQALSVKPGRVGYSQAQKIAAVADAGGVSLCSGMYAESALGTLISLQFACTLKSPLVPNEQSFYHMMREHDLIEPLAIVGGKTRLPDTADLASLINWEIVERNAI